MATILVVDDEPAILDLLVGVLGKEGHTLLAAADGTRATEVLGRVVPDLVVTDAMMPRLDGAGLIRWMRGRVELREVPVLLLSAGPRLDAGALGAVGFVAKPFDLATLLAAVGAALGHPPA